MTMDKVFIVNLMYEELFHSAVAVFTTKKRAQAFVKRANSMVFSNYWYGMNEVYVDPRLPKNASQLYKIEMQTAGD